MSKVCVERYDEVLWVGVCRMELLFYHIVGCLCCGHPSAAAHGQPEELCSARSCQESRPQQAQGRLNCNSSGRLCACVMRSTHHSDTFFIIVARPCSWQLRSRLCCGRCSTLASPVSRPSGNDQTLLAVGFVFAAPRDYVHSCFTKSVWLANLELRFA